MHCLLFHSHEQNTTQDRTNQVPNLASRPSVSICEMQNCTLRHSDTVQKCAALVHFCTARIKVIGQPFCAPWKCEGISIRGHIWMENGEDSLQHCRFARNALVRELS
jgi:hypothetical protein